MKVRLETSSRPLASVIQKAFDVNANYLMMAARMMPEAAYGFRPTPELRTFGEQINHATAAQYSSDACNRAVRTAKYRRDGRAVFVLQPSRRAARHGATAAAQPAPGDGKG